MCTLIDMSVIRDFMSLTFTKKVRILLEEKSDVYKVTAVDDKLLSYNNDMIDHKTDKIRLQIRPHVQNM